MHKLSTGEDSTLKNWRINAVKLWGEDSAAVAYLDALIAKQGDQCEIIQDERQVINMLANLNAKAQTN